MKTFLVAALAVLALAAPSFACPPVATAVRAYACPQVQAVTETTTTHTYALPAVQAVDPCPEAALQSFAVPSHHYGYARVGVGGYATGGSFAVRRVGVRAVAPRIRTRMRARVRGYGGFGLGGFEAIDPLTGFQLQAAPAFEVVPSFGLSFFGGRGGFRRFR